MTFDVLIRNATIVDGSGAPRFPGDIGIRCGRIEIDVIHDEPAQSQA